MLKLDGYIRRVLCNPPQFNYCHSQENLRVVHPPDQLNHR
jgi:hypothetical protein